MFHKIQDLTITTINIIYFLINSQKIFSNWKFWASNQNWPIRKQNGSTQGCLLQFMLNSMVLMQLTTKIQRETKKRDVNIKGTDSVILLGLSATLKYCQLARISGCGSGYGGGSVIRELPTGVFWDWKTAGAPPSL